MISIVVAMAKNRVIGKDNQMPWHLPADLKHFKAITMGKPIIMGRKTFESIGKALPGRRNMVITRQNLQFENCEMYASLELALEAVKDEPEIMIIGGANVFEQALPLTHRMYLTFIDLDVEGDTAFPDWDKKQWHEVANERHKADEKNRYDYQFVTLER